MHTVALQGCSILVVEDEYIMAMDLHCSLEDAGATVLGPVGSVADALAILDVTADIHAAILDVNLGKETAYAIADALSARDVPFVFTTGYDKDILPPRFAHVTVCTKPLDMRAVTQALAAQLNH